MMAWSPYPDRSHRADCAIVTTHHLVCTCLAKMPRGLCADKQDHEAHVHTDPALGTFWCTANQADREPYRSEQRRKQA